MEERVAVEQRGPVQVVRLSDPAVRNALTREVKFELEGAIDAFVANTSARCMLLTGSDGYFSAGGDVRSFTEPATTVSNRTRLTNSHRLLMKFVKAEKPIVTAVNGPAVGAGFGLAMIGDIVVASDNAFFQPAFPAIGIAPDFGLAKTLPRAVGDKRAKDILMTNARVTADEALRIGIISRLYAKDELLEKALALAEGLGNGPTLAHGLAKVLVANADHSSMEDFFALEAAAQAVAMSSDDHKEGVQAFLQKRKATFKGT
jgi:2-(1,2-epoxy-1,2-dihydrophenyl)acetyl-CoA isomerase